MDRQIQVGLPTDIDLGKCDLLVGIADGDCMDSPEAPIRIKDGQRVFAHSYADDFNIYRDREILYHRVCVVQYIADGKRYFAVKEISFFDELTGKLRLTYYNPKKTNVWLKIDAIEKVYFVDGVEE